MHAGLWFGIYADAGRYTCALRAGSMGRELQDAQTFAGWGVGVLCYMLVVCLSRYRTTANC